MSQSLTYFLDHMFYTEIQGQELYSILLDKFYFNYYIPGKMFCQIIYLMEVFVSVLTVVYGSGASE